ncbi:hypothetical protein PC128_g18897 [Phytophthora cactorum]|nr:hypothetical protein PC128_g18897 [Phytophthora cactorum]
MAWYQSIRALEFVAQFVHGIYIASTISAALKRVVASFIVSSFINRPMRSPPGKYFMTI